MEMKQKQKSLNKKFLDISNTTSPFFRRTSREFDHLQDIKKFDGNPASTKYKPNFEMVELPVNPKGSMFGKQTEERMVTRDFDHPLHIRETAAIGGGYATVDHDRLSRVH